MLLLAAMAPVAEAHTCAFADHLVCNGHQCPDDLVGDLMGHDHQTFHGLGGTHWCQSGGTPEARAFGLVLFAAQLPARVPAWLVHLAVS